MVILPSPRRMYALCVYMQGGYIMCCVSSYICLLYDAMLSVFCSKSSKNECTMIIGGPWWRLQQPHHPVALHRVPAPRGRRKRAKHHLEMPQRALPRRCSVLGANPRDKQARGHTGCPCQAQGRDHRSA